MTPSLPPRHRAAISGATHAEFDEASEQEVPWKPVAGSLQNPKVSSTA